MKIQIKSKYSSRQSEVIVKIDIIKCMKLWEHNKKSSDGWMMI